MAKPKSEFRRSLEDIYKVSGSRTNFLNEIKRGLEKRKISGGDYEFLNIESLGSESEILNCPTVACYGEADNRGFIFYQTSPGKVRSVRFTLSEYELFFVE